jgi:hypothetical protein
MVNVYCQGKARIKHRVTGSIFEIDGQELEWEESGDEGEMGVEICHEAGLDHPELGTLV